MTEAKIKTKISVKDTLLAIPVGEGRVIKNRVIKSSVIRSAIQKMKPEGYSFTVSEAGRIDDVLVTRNN